MTNKKILTLISLLLFLFLLVGCFPTENHPPIITTTALPGAIVGTAYTATVQATDADGDALTFSISNEPTDMVISKAGVISGWTPDEDEVGTEAVTVAVTDGKDSVSADFTITVSELVKELDHIVVLPETMPLIVEKSDTIKSVTAHYSDGSFAPVALGDCTYKSDDEKVATVKEVDGVVTVKALTTGSATITVSYTEEKITKTVYIEETDTLKVTVSAVKLDHIVVVPKTMTFDKEWTDSPDYVKTIESVTAHYNDGDTDDVDLGDCEYGLSKLDIVSVDVDADSVTVKPLVKGTTTITVSYEEEDVTAEASIPVTVPNRAPIITAIEDKIHSISANPFTYLVEATDPDEVDGDILTYFLDSCPVGMNIEPTTGLIAWYATDTCEAVTVKVRVTDDDEFDPLSDTEDFTIEVT